MSGVGEASLVLSMISSIIAIIDATNQVYEAVKDESGLPTNFKKSATKLPTILKLLDDAERYLKAADESTKAAFTPTLEDCKVQATHLQELFEKVIPEEGDSRLDRYVKAARTIGKGGRVENLMNGILHDLQLLATKFPEVTTPRGKDQLAKAVEEVTRMDPSLPDGFEQMPAYAHYGSGAQNVNPGSGIQHINSGTGHQNSGSGQQYIGTNHIVNNHLLSKNITVDDIDRSCLGTLSVIVGDMSENIWKEEHSKIMQWLSSTNFWGKQVDLFSRAQKGSGQWILEDERLKSWLTGHPKICWCKGEAGAGKTFLSAIIINYLSFSMKNKNIGIAWLYVDYRERDSHTLENFYANLLLQLFKQIGGLSKSMMKSLRSKREEAKPSAAEYKSWLQEEVQKFERTIIIIDALDEMRTKELCEQLIDELQSLIPRIHLLVTSRSEVQLPIMSDDVIEIDIRPRKDDVILFIESRLQDSPLLWDHISKTSSLRDLTIDMLTKANNRMFLKAELILNVLEHLKTAKEVEETLNSLPDTYDGCYEFTLKQIERKDAPQRQLAFKVLSWLSFVFDGLTVSAFQEALSFQTGDKKVDEEKLIPMEELISVCSGLVVTYSDTENNTQKIRLLHETASTYLKNVGSPLGHEMILEACLASLSSTKFSKLCISRTRIDERGRQHPFYQYAATYWSRHVIEGKLETTFRDPIIRFLESYQRHSAYEFRSLGLPSAWGCDKSTPWTDWNKLSGDRRDLPLHAAAAYGLGEIVRYFIKEKGYEKDGRNNFRETALHRAAQVGCTGTMEELIAQGADLNSRVYHHYFKETTALILAMNCQQIEAVRTLLNHGADLNTFDPKNPTFPLHIAASMNTSLTRLLLDHGATVHFPGISPQFPELWPGSLHFTVFNAHEFPGALERVNLLLDRGTNINAQSSAGNTALHIAILGGQQDLVHILLQKGANITLKNQRSKSAVQLARERGHLDWIEEGIPTELFRSLPIGPPLQRAIWSRNYSLVHELLEKGHDIAEEDQEMVTPWGYCILSGDVELAQILVDYMEKRKSISLVGNTAFELALTHMTAFNYTDKWSWEKTIQICRKLLPFRRVFDPNLEFTKTESPICNYKKTFLIWAVQLGRIDEAEFFLDCGSDVNARDFFGASALYYAAGGRSYDMVKLLIRRGANPKLEANTGLTPLMIAENAGNIVIKKLFQDASSG